MPVLQVCRRLVWLLFVHSVFVHCTNSVKGMPAICGRIPGLVPFGFLKRGGHLPCDGILFIRWVTCLWWDVFLNRLHGVGELLYYVMLLGGSKIQSNQGEIDLANGTAEERDRANSYLSCPHLLTVGSSFLIKP